jgi:hypothetical protein
MTAARLSLLLVPLLLVGAKMPEKKADPVAFVRAFYAPKVDHAKHRDAWFSDELAALLAADEKRSAASPDEVCGLDFDPYVDSQDEVGPLKRAKLVRPGPSPQVEVRFRDAPKHSVIVELVPVADGWRISNFRYPKSEDPELVGLLRKMAAVKCP